MLPSKDYDYGWIKGYKVQYTTTVTSVHKHKVRACCIVYNTHAERSCLAMAEWVMFEAAKELHIYINPYPATKIPLLSKNFVCTRKNDNNLKTKRLYDVVRGTILKA